MLRHGVLLFAVISASAGAETVTGYFVAPMFGATFGGELETSDVDAQGTRDTVGQLKIDNDSHFGLMMGLDLAKPGNVYLLYSSQKTRFEDGNLAPSNGLDVDINYYHFGGSLYFPNNNLVPYVTASAGATQISPSGNFSDEWAFSIGIGGGVHYNLTDNFALFADVRAFFSGYDRSSDLVCLDDDDNCVIRVEGDALIQTQANLGFAVRF